MAKLPPSHVNVIDLLETFAMAIDEIVLGAESPVIIGPFRLYGWVLARVIPHFEAR